MAQGPHRREPRRFEPPPWEREQFERLERERAERERRELEEAAARAKAAALEQPPAEPAGSPVAAAPRRVAPPVAAGPDEARVDAMLAALAVEEPPAVSDAWRFGLIAATFVGTVGMMLVIWGMVALARSQGGGPVGIMGALIVSVMGGLFVALAAWMGARSLKQRGVR